MAQIDERWSQGAPKLVLQLTPEEPQLTLDTGGKAVEFLFDICATYSVLANLVTRVVKFEVFYKIPQAQGADKVYLLTVPSGLHSSE